MMPYSEIEIFMKSGKMMLYKGATPEQRKDAVVMSVYSGSVPQLPPALKVLMAEYAQSGYDWAGYTRRFPMLPDTLEELTLYNCKLKLFRTRLPAGLRVVRIRGRDTFLPRLPAGLQELHLEKLCLVQDIPHGLRAMSLLNMLEPSRKYKPDIPDTVRTLTVDESGMRYLKRWPAQLCVLDVRGTVPEHLRNLPLPRGLERLICPDTAAAGLKPEHIPRGITVTTAPMWRQLDNYDMLKVSCIRKYAEEPKVPEPEIDEKTVARVQLEVEELRREVTAISSASEALKLLASSAPAHDAKVPRWSQLKLPIAP